MAKVTWNPNDKSPNTILGIDNLEAKLANAYSGARAIIPEKKVNGIGRFTIQALVELIPS